MLGKIDVLINSASRMDYLLDTVTSMLKNLEYSGGFRLILHDDVVNKAGSAQIAKWVEESKLFDVFVRTEPARRLGIAVYKCLRLIQSKYVVKWEDDWKFLQPVSLDDILAVMETYTPQINQIAFNKHGNEFHKHGIVRPVVEFEGFKLTQVQEWVIGPGIWRTDFAISKWPNNEDAHSSIAVFGTVDLPKGRDYKWVADNVGCYFYGGHNEGPYLEHLGAKSSWFSAVEGA